MHLFCWWETSFLFWGLLHLTPSGVLTSSTDLVCDANSWLVSIKGPFYGSMARIYVGPKVARKIFNCDSSKNLCLASSQHTVKSLLCPGSTPFAHIKIEKSHTVFIKKPTPSLFAASKIALRYCATAPMRCRALLSLLRPENIFL